MNKAHKIFKNTLHILKCYLRTGMVQFLSGVGWILSGKKSEKYQTVYLFRYFQGVGSRMIDSIQSMCFADNFYQM